MILYRYHITTAIAITFLLWASSCSNSNTSDPNHFSIPESDSLVFTSFIDSANSHRITGELNDAKAFADSAKAIASKNKWGMGIAESHNVISYINLYESDFESSMENALEALEVSEANEDLKNQGFANLMIGYVHFSLGDTTIALPFYRKSIRIRKQLQNDYDLGFSYSYLGNYYLSTGIYDSALFYHNLSLTHRIETSDTRSIADSYLLIGSTLFKLEKHDDALNHFGLALSKYKQIDDKKRLAETYRNFAEVHLTLGDTTKAEAFLLSAYETADYIGALDNLIPISDQLSIIKNKNGDFEEAYDYLRFHVSTKNRTSNNKKHREITKKILEYKAEKEKKIQELEFSQKEEKQEIIYQAVSVLVLFLIIFLIFVFSRLKLTRRQKEIIAEKKELVDKAFDQLEDKNQEILDSINYAKRIQSAILPSEKMIKNHLPNSFTLYKPKDIVAGDFYWMETSTLLSPQNKKEGTEQCQSILFAVADCTGHGVPGAMISVVCNNALNRSVHEYGFTKPNEILNKTRELISKEFEKSEEDVKDGMDIALCSLQNNILNYAGANNPLWIIRKDSKEIEIVKANNQPIGMMSNPEPYTNNVIQLNKGDVFYLFSDGYYDQFGGERGKKYKSGKFKKFLLSIQNYPIEEQHDILNTEFENWRGKIEQIDDVCIIGVRI